MENQLHRTVNVHFLVFVHLVLLDMTVNFSELRCSFATVLLLIHLAGLENICKSILMEKSLQYKEMFPAKTL